MALYVRQDDNRTELQEKIAAELREKQIKNSLGEGGDTPKNKKEPNVQSIQFFLKKKRSIT